tara:strand:+ start:14292 stop:14528 length:237 start_codon:yes stop_codon:yes gene_type:complete
VPVARTTIAGSASGSAAAGPLRRIKLSERRISVGGTPRAPRSRVHGPIARHAHRSCRTRSLTVNFSGRAVKAPGTTIS